MPLSSAMADLKHEDFRVRRRAVVTLANLGGTRAVQPLIGALQDEHHAVRRAATRALGKIGDPQACLALMKFASRCNTWWMGLIGSLDMWEPEVPSFINERLIQKNEIQFKNKLIMKLLFVMDWIFVIIPVVIFPLIVMAVLLMNYYIFNYLNITSRVTYGVFSFLAVVGINLIILYPGRSTAFYFLINRFFHWNLNKFSKPDIFWNYIIFSGKLTGFGVNVVLRLAKVIGDNIGNDGRMKSEIMKALQKILDKSRKIQPVPFCPKCLVRMGEFGGSLGFWKPVKLFGCRQCREAGPMLKGVKKAVLVLDRRDEGRSEPAALTNGVLRIHWFARPRALDLDELVIGQIRARDVEAFILDWAEEADNYQRGLLKSRPVTLLPEAQVDTNDLRLLKERFMEVRG